LEVFLAVGNGPGHACFVPATRLLDERAVPVGKTRFAAEWGSIEEVRVDPVRDYRDPPRLYIKEGESVSRTGFR
jgi:hypothetical protein